MKNPTIIIEIKGGAVIASYANREINLIIVDHDVEPAVTGPLEMDGIHNYPETFFSNTKEAEEVEKIIDHINNRDYPNMRNFLVKDKTGRGYTVTHNTADLLTQFDPDAEDYDGERLFEFAEGAEPGEWWESEDFRIDCIQ